MVCSRSTGAGEPRIAEGPEVNLFAVGLQRFSGSLINTIALGPKCPSVRDLSTVVLPSTLRSVGCHGQLLWLDIDERIMIVNVGQHMRIAGALADARYMAVQLSFAAGAIVHLTDRRRFVSVRIVEPADVRRMVAGMGPSVLDVHGGMDLTSVIAAACSVQRSIAEALHDQAVIAGVGQRLASEALLASCVSPWRPADQVQRSEWRALLDALHVESHRALAIGTVASAGEMLPSLAWQLPAVAYGRTHLADGTALVHEQCVSGWTITWAPGVQS